MGDDDRWKRAIRTASRDDRTGVALTLSCGHAVLRHPKWPIPCDLLTDCEVCAADSQELAGRG